MVARGRGPGLTAGIGKKHYSPLMRCSWPVGRPIALASLVLAPMLALTACGGGKKSTTSASTGSTPAAPTGQHKGGTLLAFSNADFDNIDPGIAYYQLTYEWLNAAQRPLMSFKPDDPEREVPDLAAAPPTISSDGKTVTVHIKPGVRFSPPVNRAVTSADVKYAIERGFTKQVATGYLGAYFGGLEGAPSAPGDYKPIPGIQTPDKTTLVFKLSKPLGGQLAQALALPVTVPVPKEYAKQYDAKTPSQYGPHQVTTGPYMIQNYTPGRRIVLVRNPNWDPKTDYRPAYVDKVDWQIGANPTVSGRQVLNGHDMISADFVPAPVVKEAAQKHKSQVAFISLGTHYIALNTKIPPFDNANLRKAVAAATDKTALQLTWGGSIVGDIATHLIPPAVPGYDQAGGAKGPSYDFDTTGPANQAAVTKYMKLAGFTSGKYHGPKIFMVGSSADPGVKMSEAFLNVLEKLGFSVNFKAVEDSTMYTQFCNRPSSKYNVCPVVQWFADFPDASTVLDPTFNGEHIVANGNSNWPQLDDPKINAALDHANTLLTPTERATAYAAIDRQITATAGAIPWFWDKRAILKSSNVKGVVAKWNACWDLSYTSVR
jgi:peptide/nickel transport system substrate-binding protein